MLVRKEVLLTVSIRERLRRLQPRMFQRSLSSKNYCLIKSTYSISTLENISRPSYQFVIDPSGRKYVCARAVTRSVHSATCFSFDISSSTPRPGRSFG